MSTNLTKKINYFLENYEINEQIVSNNIDQIDESLSEIEINFSKIIKQIEEIK